MMALTRIAAVLALVASSAQGHVQVQPSMVTYDASTDITLTVPHGGDVAGTKMILVKLPPGTYATKPVPLYGFDLSVDQRELNPPRGLWGKLKNTTVDTITWTGTGGFELPTWAIDYLRFTTVFTPQEGVLHFRVSQLLTDNTWLNWTIGEDTAKPVNLTALPTTDDDEHMAHGGRRSEVTAEAPHDHEAMLASQASASTTVAPTPTATKASAAPTSTKNAAPTSGSKQDEAPAVMVMSPDALAEYNAPKCNCDTSDLEKQLADLKAIVDQLTSGSSTTTQR